MNERLAQFMAGKSYEVSITHASDDEIRVTRQFRGRTHEETFPSLRQAIDEQDARGQRVRRYTERVMEGYGAGWAVGGPLAVATHTEGLFIAASTAYLGVLGDSARRLARNMGRTALFEQAVERFNRNSITF